jgi:Zn finger protein HypA/HybF involved in hydrogenase expression
MPIRPPKAYDFKCNDCGHKFRQSFWNRLINPGGAIAKVLRPCPKCGSKNTSLIIY